MSGTIHGSAPADGSAHRAARALLALGFVALAAAVAVGIATPASAYETSIYGATPVAFWVATGVAFAAAVLVAFSAAARGWRGLGIALGGASIAAVVALPVVRGYYFYGTADPLTHVGWARDLLAGTAGPRSLIYPGIHTLAAAIGATTGLTLYYAMELVIVAFGVVFLAFVPLAVGLVTRRMDAIAIGAFAGFLLLPVNNLSMHMRAHPFSQTTLYGAAILFGLVLYVTDDGERGGYLSTVALLAVLTVGTVLYHPQSAADMLLVFGAVAALQFGYRRRRPDHPLATHRAVYLPTAVFAAGFAAWAVPSEWFGRATTLLVDRLGGYLAGRPPVAGEAVLTQGASLSAIGGNVAVLFGKLFLPSVVFLALAATGAALAWTGRLRVWPRTDATARVLAAGLAVLVPIFLAYYLANIAEMYFRHLGVVMVFATVLGVIGLAAAGGGTRSSAGGPGRRRVLLVVLFLVLSPLAAVTIYQSPYIHKTNQHVTAMDVDGYEAAFATYDEDLTVAGVREGPRRFSDAIQGNRSSVEFDRALDGSELTRLGESLDGGGYLVYTTRDRTREVAVYRELRYTDAQFDAIDEQVGVARVLANGGVTVVYVPPEE